MTTTPTDVPSALLERLVRIETKLDIANGNSLDHEGRIRALEEDNVRGGHTDHEGRLRKLERSGWMLAGAIGLAGGGVGSFVGPFIR